MQSIYFLLHFTDDGLAYIGLTYVYLFESDIQSVKIMTQLDVDTVT